MKKISTISFISTNLDDLADGIQPFLFCQHNPADEERAVRSALLYDAVSNGVMRPTVEEMKSILEGTVKGSARLPPSDIHGINMIEKLRMVLYVLFGPNHPVLEKTTAFISNYGVPWPATSWLIESR